jgi:hypothetical protein
MKLHNNLKNYLSKDLLTLNQLLFELDEAKHEHEDGDTHFLCDVSGICAATDDEDGKPDGYISYCFFCGAELTIFKGDFYHYSAFNDMEKFSENYMTYITHNHQDLEYGKHAVSKEQERVFELEDKINKLRTRIFKKEVIE